MTSVAELLSASLEEEVAVDSLERIAPKPADVAVFQLSGGTTGLPKPISISHGVVAQRLAFYSAPVDPDAPQATDMMSAPIFHIGGTLGLLVSLHAGHKLVVLPRFDAGSWLRAVEEHRVSQTFVVPTMLQRILDHPDFGSRDLSSLRLVNTGSMVVPESLIRAFHARGVAVGQIYGATEFGSVTWNPPDEIDFDPESVGRPLPGVEIRVLDACDPRVNRPLAPGDEGQVAVAAPSMLAEYVDQPGTPLRDGFLL